MEYILGDTFRGYPPGTSVTVEKAGPNCVTLRRVPLFYHNKRLAWVSKYDHESHDIFYSGEYVMHAHLEKDCLLYQRCVGVVTVDELTLFTLIAERD